MKKLLLVLLLAWAVPAGAADVLLRYDLDSLVATSCIMTGQNGAVLTAPVPVSTRIVTGVGATDLTAVVAGSSPFLGLAVGDVIIVNTNTVRVIVTYTDADNIVVDEAVTVASSPFQYYKVVCGADGGWFPMYGAATWTTTWQIDQVNVVGGIDMRLECRSTGIGKGAVQVWPSCVAGACGTYQNYAGIAGITSRTSITTDSFIAGECRIVMLIHTGDDVAGDAGANKERINISLEKR